jgi:DNA-binding NarL/FixJ family response regulator
MNPKPLADASEPVHRQAHNMPGSARVAQAQQIKDTEAATRDPSSLVRLTPRQAEVLRLLAKGMTNRTIAVQMDLSIHTVDSHVHTIYKKLQVTTRGSAVRYAIEHNLG